MDKASSLLPKVLNKHGLKTEAEASLIVHHANRWLKSQEVPSDVCATQLKDDVLILETKNSASAQECQSVSEDLLLFLKQKFPKTTLTRIRIQRMRESMVG